MAEGDVAPYNSSKSHCPSNRNAASSVEASSHCAVGLPVYRAETEWDGWGKGWASSFDEPVVQGVQSSTGRVIRALPADWKNYWLKGGIG